jgi:hypothetical protein
MSFVVTGLPVGPFQPLFGLSDAELAAQGVRRHTADKPQGYPCRITLRDARPGETLLLLNYEHQPADTPYRARHAIFVGEQATEAATYRDEVPPSLAVRPHISLRAFDAAGNMTDGTVVPGAELAPAIEQLLGAEDVAYLHAHYAGRGCFAARIDRA